MSERVVAITGGAGGMGLAAAKLLGRERRVLLSDVREDRLAEAVAELRDLGIDADTIAGDVASRADVDAIAARAASLGEVAAVVHTAGVSPQMGSSEAIVRINALGTVHVAEAFLPLATEGFALVNVASTAGHLPRALRLPARTCRLAATDPDRFVAAVGRRCRPVPEARRTGMAYSLSKQFAIWYSQHLAGDLGAVGASVVSVSPGSIDTEMGRLEDEAGAGDLARRSALGRFGRVEEVAAVLELCAGGRATYLTGTDILVDGGAAAVMTFRDVLEMARR